MGSRIGRDYNDVYVFLHVVQAGSFTAAGRSLNMPKSGVSRRVTRLETELGVRLLHRSTRKLSLTEAGRRYFEQAKTLFDGLVNAEGELTEAQSVPKGRIKIAAPAEHAISAELVVRFLRAHPQVRVDVLFTGRTVNPIEEGFDAVISIGAPSSLSVVARRLLDSAFHLVAAPMYLAEHPAPTEIADLTAHAIIAFGPPTPLVTWQLDPDGATRIQLVPRASFTHLGAVRSAALAGLGIASLPGLSCRADLAAGRLVEVLPGQAGPSVPIWLEYPSGRTLPRATRVFIDFVRAHFASVAESFGE
jgi:DNA-binding transcriptional LysR family regulator